MCGRSDHCFTASLYSDKGIFHSDLNAARNVNMSEYALKQNSLRLTLNHRVPGSSPGAPTKLFKGLAGIRGFHSDKLWPVIPTKRLVLFARHGVSGRRKQAASGCASRTSATAAPTGGVLLRAARHRRDR